MTEPSVPKSTDTSMAGMTAASAMVTLFANGRIYLLLFLISSLVALTVLAALHVLDAQAIVAIFSALIGGAVGHANGYVQATLNEINRQDRNRTNGLG